MEQTAAPIQPPPISATTTTATHPDSVDSSPRSRNTDSWGEENSQCPSNNGSTAVTAAAAGGLTKLRLMCSYGGHIVPRPHDKSLCYVGGDTRIVVVDRHTTLSDLTHRLAKTLLRSISSTSASFTVKYQLPSEDLDSLISVTTDEDLENMIDEYERLNSSSDVSKSSRLRLFLFPSKSESASSIGSLLESTTKSEDWFLNALNGTSSGFSDTSSVNCLLGLEEDVSIIPEKKDVNNKGVIGKNLRGNNSVQDVQSVPDSPMLETSSSFGSASSSPSLANLPPIRVNVDDQQKVGGAIEEQFSQMSLRQQHLKHQEDVAFVAAPAPVVITGVPIVSKVPITENPNRVLSEDERSEQVFQMAYRKQQQQQQQQYQQKQSMGFDLASPDSVSSDGSVTNPLSRRKPSVIYQDPVTQSQFSSNNNNRATDSTTIHDQNNRIQMQQQQRQQIQDSAYLMSTPSTQVDPQHPQLHHQSQFIHTAVPPPQYIHHHPSGAVPMASYYPMYPSQNQHHAPHPALDQHNFVYYMPARPPPQSYNLPLQPDTPPAPPNNQVPPPSSLFTAPRNAQAATKTESPVYRTTNSGPPAPQLVQVPSSQHQLQPQYVGYSHIHQPSQSVASSAASNYAYEFADPSQQGQHIYYTAQPLAPQAAGQYQTMASTLPVEAGSHVQTDNSMAQQVRTSQP